MEAFPLNNKKIYVITFCCKKRIIVGAKVGIGDENP